MIRHAVKWYRAIKQFILKRVRLEPLLEVLLLKVEKKVRYVSFVYLNELGITVLKIKKNCIKIFADSYPKIPDNLHHHCKITICITVLSRHAFNQYTVSIKVFCWTELVQVNLTLPLSYQINALEDLNPAISWFKGSLIIRTSNLKTWRYRSRGVDAGILCMLFNKVYKND